MVSRVSEGVMYVLKPDIAQPSMPNNAQWRTKNVDIKQRIDIRNKER
jgi:hypothetical protein